MIFPSTFLFTTNPSCLMLRDGVDFRGQFSRGWLRNHRRLNVGADQYIQPFRTALAASASHSHSLCRSSRTCLRIGVATSPGSYPAHHWHPVYYLFALVGMAMVSWRASKSQQARMESDRPITDQGNALDPTATPFTGSAPETSRSAVRAFGVTRSTARCV